MDSSIRTGLPRIPGGPRWPEKPAHGLTSIADESTRESGVEEISNLPQNESGSSPKRSLQTAKGSRVTRQGLPRTANGSPWPPIANDGQQTSHPSNSGPSSFKEATQRKQDQPPTAPMVPPNDHKLAGSTSVSWFIETDDLKTEGITPSAKTSFPPAAPPGPSAPEVSEQPNTDRISPATASGLRGRGTGTGRARVVARQAAGVGVALIALVLLARWATSLDPVRTFIQDYPGEYHLPGWAPVGIPSWLAWQHFFSAFLMALIIRTGIQIRMERKPPAYWSRRSGKNARKISVTAWFHQALDMLWLTNGLVFVILLFVTGQWIRIVPSSWEVFPNALSALLQYISLDWPTENGWVNYNSLQQLSYFTTIFIAAPLAVLTGVRMSPVWPARPQVLTRNYPIEFARALHFPVMIYFCVFIAAHVFLVFATGALRNLNHMYGGQDSDSGTGLLILLASLLVTGAGLWAARPLLITPIASLFGKVSR